MVEKGRGNADFSSNPEPEIISPERQGVVPFNEIIIPKNQIGIVQFWLGKRLCDNSDLETFRFVSQLDSQTKANAIFEMPDTDKIAERPPLGPLAKELDRIKRPLVAFLITTPSSAEHPWVNQLPQAITEYRQKVNHRDDTFVYKIIMGGGLGFSKRGADDTRGHYWSSETRAHELGGVYLFYNDDAPTAGSIRLVEYMNRLLGKDLPGDNFPNYTEEQTRRIAWNINRESFNVISVREGSIPKYPIGEDGKPILDNIPWIQGKKAPDPETLIDLANKEKEKYLRDFLADARYHHRHPSVLDILDREEEIKRPYHRILTYPAEFSEIMTWNNEGRHKDINDAVSAYYADKPYMVDKRARFPSPLVPDYIDHYGQEFEERLKRTLAEKPWLIDFSVKWQEVLQRSFIGGNYREDHAGEVEFVFKNPRYDPKKSSFFNHKYEDRTLEPEEERLFLESVVDIQSLADQKPPVRPPEQPWVFNGQTGTPYLFKLSDGREFNIFLKHEYGSIYWEGKLAIISHGGPEPLFKYTDRQSGKTSTSTPGVETFI